MAACASTEGAAGSAASAAAPPLLLLSAPSVAVAATSESDELLRPVQLTQESASDSRPPRRFTNLLEASAVLEDKEAFESVLQAYVSRLEPHTRAQIIPVFAFLTSDGKLHNPELVAWKILRLIDAGFLRATGSGWNVYVALLATAVDVPLAMGVCTRLLAAGANPRLPSPGGLTPLHILCGEKYAEQGVVDLIEKFVAAGVNVNAKDSSGLTPLHVAAEFARSAVVERLLTLGADVNARDMGGDTVITCLIRRAPGATPTEFIRKLDALKRMNPDMMAVHAETGIHAVTNIIQEAMPLLQDFGSLHRDVYEAIDSFGHPLVTLIAMYPEVFLAQ